MLILNPFSFLFLLLYGYICSFTLGTQFPLIPNTPSFCIHFLSFPSGISLHLHFWKSILSDTYFISSAPSIFCRLSSLIYGPWSIYLLQKSLLMFLRKFSLNSAVGAPRPSQRELDDDVMHNSFIVADSVESATNEAGDVILSKVN